MSYIELEDLRLYLGDKGGIDNSLLESAIEDAQTYIESQTNRVFEAIDETRYYTHDDLYPNTRTLRVDRDLLSVTTLTNGDTAATVILPTSYTLLPRNDVPPYHYIELTDASNVQWEQDTDRWITVLGKWGYSVDAPYDIKRAALVLAAYFYKQKDSQIFDTTAIPGAGVITIPQGIPTTVTRIIERYKVYL